MIDEKKRISIHDIKAHDWYNRALPQRYQHAELDLVEQQKELEAHLSTRELDQASPSLIPPQPSMTLSLFRGLKRAIAFNVEWLDQLISLDVAGTM